MKRLSAALAKSAPLDFPSEKSFLVIRKCKTKMGVQFRFSAAKKKKEIKFVSFSYTIENRLALRYTDSTSRAESLQNQDFLSCSLFAIWIKNVFSEFSTSCTHTFANKPVVCPTHYIPPAAVSLVQNSRCVY